MKFGVSFARPPESRSREVVHTAIHNGFTQFWAWDSHIIWNECYTLLGWLIGGLGDRAKTVDWGTMVTNPVTRDPLVAASAFATLNNLTQGHAICGIGRGDSSVRVVRRHPARLADVERATKLIQTLTAGETFPLGVEATVTLATGNEPWPKHGKVPVYHAAYGPKALHLAGRVADGVIFQIADPYFIEWGIRQVRTGADEVGRDLKDIRIHCATPSVVCSDPSVARDQLRWFPAAVGNHIADVLRKNDPGDLPRSLTDYVHHRSEYDYHEHGELRSDHSSYVPDEIVDRFCVHGPPERHYR